MKNKQLYYIPLTALFSIVVLCIAPFIGMENYSFSVLFANDLHHDIFWSLRVPRVITAFIAGGGLAICGMIFQAMFRNPLADPFTLGIASGASCGASIMIVLGFGGVVLGIPILSIGAFAGAGISMVVVYSLASMKRTSSSVTMLLAGIAVSFLSSSLLMFVQYISDLRESFHIVRWLMGGIEVYGYRSLIIMIPFTIAGVIMIFLHLPHLDQLCAGEDIAQSRGVNVRLTKNLLLLAATLIVGSIVSVCGPIGFIGLLAPHLCRSLFSSNHRILGPASFLLGGAFLIICDTVARIIIAPAEIPVGVITALIGGPFFLWILFRRKDSGVHFD